MLDRVKETQGQGEAGPLKGSCSALFKSQKAAANSSSCCAHEEGVPELSVIAGLIRQSMRTRRGAAVSVMTRFASPY